MNCFVALHDLIATLILLCIIIINYYLKADIVLVPVTFFKRCPSSQIIISNDGIELITGACFRNIYKNKRIRVNKIRVIFHHLFQN